MKQAIPIFFCATKRTPARWVFVYSSRAQIGLDFVLLFLMADRWAQAKTTLSEWFCTEQGNTSSFTVTFDIPQVWDSPFKYICHADHLLIALNVAKGKTNF